MRRRDIARIIRNLYAERRPMLRARRLGKPYDADKLRRIEASIDQWEMMLEPIPVVT